MWPSLEEMFSGLAPGIHCGWLHSEFSQFFGATPVFCGIPEFLDECLDCFFDLHVYHLSQNYYITARYFWTINFGRRNVKITSQKLFLNYFWAP